MILGEYILKYERKQITHVSSAGSEQLRSTGVRSILYQPPINIKYPSSRLDHAVPRSSMINKSDFHPNY